MEKMKGFNYPREGGGLSVPCLSVGGTLLGTSEEGIKHEVSCE